jgi:hypothetical protein
MVWKVGTVLPLGFVQLLPNQLVTFWRRMLLAININQLHLVRWARKPSQFFFLQVQDARSVRGSSAKAEDILFCFFVLFKDCS